MEKATVSNGTVRVGDKFRLVGDTDVMVVGALKRNKQVGVEVIPNTARHDVGFPAKFCERVGED